MNNISIYDALENCNATASSRTLNSVMTYKYVYIYVRALSDDDDYKQGARNHSCIVHTLQILGYMRALLSENCGRRHHIAITGPGPLYISYHYCYAFSSSPKTHIIGMQLDVHGFQVCSPSIILLTLIN